MATLTLARMAELLSPYGLVSENALPALSAYLDLLMQWNARTNLTAIREPEALVQRQMGESILAAELCEPGQTLLDFGSGAGFPGIPLQIVMPTLRVTLAESQGKKASFLREAVRVLSLPCAIFAGRVEDMPVGARFDRVAMRAVDRSAEMLEVANSRVDAGGGLIRYLPLADSEVPAGWARTEILPIPLSTGRIALEQRIS